MAWNTGKGELKAGRWGGGDDRLVNMRFGKWLVVVLLWVGCGVAARAQAGVYFGYSATQFSGITCNSGSTPSTAIPCSNGTAAGGTGNVNPSGLFVGGYYDFKTYGPVRLGADVRYMDDKSNKSAGNPTGGSNATSANTILGGVRGVFRTPYGWLKPYGVIDFGRTSSNATEPNGAYVSSSSPTPVRQYDSFFQYEVFAGADVRILPYLDIRPIELGIGNMNRFGSGSGSSSAGVKSIGAGIVLHMP